jgi:hypothetical protein
MLRLHPDKRAKAASSSRARLTSSAARKKWGEAVGLNLANAGGGGGSGDVSPNSKLKAALDQSEADAMKPIDDIAVLSDTDRVVHTSPSSIIVIACAPSTQVIQCVYVIVFPCQREHQDASYSIIRSRTGWSSGSSRFTTTPPKIFCEIYLFLQTLKNRCL